MDKMQQLIIDTYKEKPKHFSQILKRDAKILEYIKSNVPNTITNFLEQLYYCVYKESNICRNGNIKPLKTFEGYSFCGKTGICKCAKESVSNSVSTTKSAFTEEQIEKSNKSRVKTNLKKYNVTNTGQTKDAKKAHEEFYDDKDKVEKVIKRIKKTKLDIHGDENYNNRTKAEKTFIERYGVKNPWLLRENNQNPNLEILKDKDKLKDYFPKNSIDEIANLFLVSIATVYRYVNLHKFRIPYVSTYEHEIVSWLQSLGVTNIVQNKRTIIGKELDIFLPDYNLAIEYNGVYWHHDRISHITKTYHYDKFKACEDKNIDLFTIFSDEWDNHKDVWKNKIKAKLKIYDKKIRASYGKIKKIDISQAKNILNEHHVQGFKSSGIYYGLEYKGDIVAVMCFSKYSDTRKKKRPDNTYELTRYVTICNVPYGASRLLNAFIKEYNPAMIISYSNNSYSNGDMYRKLGFKFESEVISHRYWHGIMKKMLHWTYFTKEKLVNQGFDKSKTAFQIMDEQLEFFRIWDCGMRAWVIDFSNETIINSAIDIIGDNNMDDYEEMFDNLITDGSSIELIEIVKENNEQ